MRSATDFLPSYISELTNLVTTGSPNFGIRQNLTLFRSAATHRSGSLYLTSGASRRTSTGPGGAW